jgi:hypothetical protein
MGFRFRKSFKIIPGIRMNVGKKGISSLTIGPRGSKININRQGINASTSIPGSGVSYNEKIFNLPGPPENNDEPKKKSMLVTILVSVLFMCAGPIGFLGLIAFLFFRYKK